MFFLCVYHVSVLHVGPPQWHLLAALEAWSVPRPRVSSADSRPVGASREIDRASHLWPFGFKKSRPFGESTPHASLYKV